MNAPSRISPPECGALVISLDLELQWGLRDRIDGSCIRAKLAGERDAVRAILRIFEKYAISATWAVVGFLFAESRAELQSLFPVRRPGYLDGRLNPYEEQVGESEEDDPLHYAPSLIRQIAESPRQEIGTHTFSHYYCLEPGQDREAFRADIASAVEISRRRNVRPRSLVFPRNQYNPDYTDILRDAGIICFRGPQRGWMHQSSPAKSNRIYRRAARLLDAYVPSTDRGLASWLDLSREGGVCNIPASQFVRPWNGRSLSLERVRFRRLVAQIRGAAESRRIAHFWWHPYNFGTDTKENLEFLEGLLREVSRLSNRSGLRSMGMAGAAAVIRGDDHAP